jgi:hypothetical protein
MTFDETLGRSRMRDPVIKLHGAEAFAAMHKAGRLTAAGLDMLGDYVKPGVTTQRLDDLAFQFAMDNGAYPATCSIAATPSRSAPRSTMSSATASPTTSRCARATSSTSTTR